MAITLSITDDQALEIMAQIGSLLTKNKSPISAPPPPVASGEPISRKILRFVHNMHKGEEFHVTRVAQGTGFSTAQVSMALCATGRRQKVVTLVKRGTWRKN